MWQVTWIGERVRDGDLVEVYSRVEGLAEWSDWSPFPACLPDVPRQPGVYLFREPGPQVVRYAGRAGDRASSGRPQGLYGRLKVYESGKAAVSGFGEAALDRALGDQDWIEQQLRRLRTKGPRRAKLWAADAIIRLEPEVSWATCAEEDDAKYLERQVLAVLRPYEMWNIR